VTPTYKMFVGDVTPTYKMSVGDETATCPRPKS
jgi:hypothetical protein